VVAQIGCLHALLGPDEVLELQGVAHEEDRGVVPDQVEVALRRVELQREAAGVPPGVWAAAFAGHRGEPGQHLGLGAGLKHRGPGVRADVVGHLEVAERAAAFRVRLPFRDTFPVELRHLLDQVVILQQDRTVGTDRQRLFVTGCGDAGISGCEALRHFAISSSTGLVLNPRALQGVPTPSEPEPVSIRFGAETTGPAPLDRAPAWLSGGTKGTRFSVRRLLPER
jgi:hypothetical protein